MLVLHLELEGKLYLCHIGSNVGIRRRSVAEGEAAVAVGHIVKAAAPDLLLLRAMDAPH